MRAGRTPRWALIGAVALVTALATPVVAQEGELPPGWTQDTSPTPPPPPPPAPTTTAPSGEVRGDAPPASVPPGWSEVESPVNPLIPLPGSGPLIRCAWQLPDMDAARPDMQYATDGGEADDDVATNPDDRCGTDSVAAEARKTIQVRAPASGLPRTVELWAAVEHPDGPAALEDVSWTVYYPDGQLKTEAVGEAVATDACEELSETVLAAATASGQLERSVVEDPNAGILASCRQGVGSMLVAPIEIMKHEPCGEYLVELRVTEGTTSALHASYFDVECYVEYQMVFDSITFTDTGEGDGPRYVTTEPAMVENLGSGGVDLSITFDAMVPVDPVTREPLEGPAIELFGASVAVGSRPPVSIAEIAAGSTVWFDAPSVTLCADEAAAFTMWLHDDGVSPGSYRGKVTITARPDLRGESGHFVCHNDNGVWVGGEQRPQP